MRGSRKFCQRGSNFDTFFFFFFFFWGGGEIRGVEGSRYHYKRAFIGPPAKRHFNGVSLAGRYRPDIECWLFSFVIFQGIRTSIAKEPYICMIVQASGPPAPSPLWIRACGTAFCSWINSGLRLYDSIAFLHIHVMKWARNYNASLKLRNT